MREQVTSAVCSESRTWLSTAPPFGQTRHVEDHAGLALDMGGHAEQCADRQHAGAADAANGDVIGPIQRRLRGRLRQIADAAEVRRRR
jgi:hypothetical protein